ncbi:MAG: glutaredoxin domain-containing protein [Myxococcota bacterium]
MPPPFAARRRSALRGGGLAPLAVALALATPGPIRADVYQYLDDAGRLHVVDSIHKVPDRYRRQAEEPYSRPSSGRGSFNTGINAPLPTPRSPAESGPQTVATLARVDVYLTSWCGYCRKLERFLKQHGIAYRRHDIERDERAKRRWKRLGGSGIPLTQVGSRVIQGYDPDAVLAALRR